MMRLESVVYAELDAAYADSRDLKLGTPEFRENRKRIAALVQELSQIQSLRPAAFTEEDYANNKDSFEQMARDRERKRRAA